MDDDIFVNRFKEYVSDNKEIHPFDRDLFNLAGEEGIEGKVFLASAGGSCCSLQGNLYFPASTVAISVINKDNKKDTCELAGDYQIPEGKYSIKNFNHRFVAYTSKKDSIEIEFYVP